MAHTTTLHLKVDADSTAAVELAPRVRAAAFDALCGADFFDRAVLFNADVLADAVTGAVMAEILRVRQATPAEAALARVRALHREEYGSCRECTHESSVLYPCATIRVLDGEEPQP